MILFLVILTRDQVHMIREKGNALRNDKIFMDIPIYVFIISYQPNCTIWHPI